MKPVSAYWEITSNCNLKCPFCAIPEKTEDLPTKEMLRIAEEISVVLEVALGGGEPFLRQDLEEIAKRLDELGVTPVIVTNGTVITKERLEKLLEFVPAIYFSIDGDKIGHERLRGPGTYERVVSSAKMAVELGFDVFINTLVTPLNSERVLKVLELARELGAKGVEFSGIVPVGRAGPELLMPPEFWRCFIDLAKRKGKELGIHVSVYLTGGPGKCKAAKTFFEVDSRGYLHPCPLLKIENPRNVLQGFEYAWNAPEMLEIRNLSRDMLGEPCRSCPNKECEGGCRAIVKALTGSVKGGNPRCWLYKSRSP